MGKSITDWLDDLPQMREKRGLEPEKKELFVVKPPSKKPLKRRKPGKPRLSPVSPTTKVMLYLTEDDRAQDKKEAESLGIKTTELYRAMRAFYYEYFATEHLFEFLPESEAAIEAKLKEIRRKRKRRKKKPQE